MKIKLPFSDKLLWDLYSLVESADKAFDLFAPRTIKQAFFPEFYQLQRKYQREITRQQFNRLIYYLKRKGYIKIKNLEEKQGVLFTKKGAEKILKLKFKQKEKKRRPDGKWQMIIFDIPEKKRYLRDLLREHLVFLGYKLFQQSVWVCPYDTFEETKEFLRRYSLDRYVKLFLIEEISL